MTTAVRIAVDAMGGDHGPRVCVPGAIAALDHSAQATLALYGDPTAIEPYLADLHADLRSRITIVPTTEVVGMDEPVRDAIRRKKNSSLRRAIDAVASGDAGACVSAGNTGAMMGMGHFVLGMIEGVERPAILAPIPSRNGHTLMLDLGANRDATAVQLSQFAVMGSVIARDVHGMAAPRVGLMNMGAEDIKGNALVKEAHRLLQALPLHYAGFIEGDAIFNGEIDVVVTDGFTGNVALKAMEGLARLISHVIREEFSMNPMRKLVALSAYPVLESLKGRLDPRRYNGASMVGLAGVVVKSHGSADAFAFANAVRTGLAEAENGLPARIAAQLAGPGGAP